MLSIISTLFLGKGKLKNKSPQLCQTDQTCKNATFPDLEWREKVLVSFLFLGGRRSPGIKRVSFAPCRRSGVCVFLGQKSASLGISRLFSNNSARHYNMHLKIGSARPVYSTSPPIPYLMYAAAKGGRGGPRLL